MPKYDVTLYYTASVTYDVEAADAAEAEEKAKAIEEDQASFEKEVMTTIEYADVIVARR